MKILVIGGSGMLGAAVVAALKQRHEVIVASRGSEHKVDLTDPASIAALYAAVGPLDAVACAAGVTPFTV